MAPRKRRFNRKTRTVISGFMVGLASIVAVIIYLDVPYQEILRLLVYTLIMFLVIILLAGVLLLVLKGVARGIRKLGGAGQEDEV